MNWLDRAITWIAPKRGYLRSRYRSATMALLAYDGARSGRRTSGWTTANTSANAEVGAALNDLRKRSRDLVRNSPYGKRAITEMVNNAVGTGIAAQADSGKDALNLKIDQVWQDWCEYCDADGQLDFAGLQALIFRSMLESGGVLIRRRLRFTTDGFAVPLQIQVLESDLLDLNKTARLDNGGYVIQGVEFD